jgi:hypothetical protein
MSRLRLSVGAKDGETRKSSGARNTEGADQEIVAEPEAEEIAK